MRSEINQERLKEVVSYDPEVGKILWRNPAKNFSSSTGKEAGTIGGDGYRRVMIDGRIYSCHMLAWMYIYGEFPSMRLDHINCIRDDNKIKNLREATHSQNMMNSPAPKSNSTGFKNVSRNRGGFLVCVRANKKSSSKWFKNLQDAAVYAESLRASMHGEFANNNRKQVES